MATNRDAVDLVGADVVTPFARAVMVAVLMAAGSWIAIPISAVPGTLQTLVVFLAALFLGPYWGAASMLLYLAAGAVGAPVFAGYEAGLGVVLGSTGGFLLTFPVAVLVIGLLIHRGGDLRRPEGVSLPLLVGALAIGTGLLYLGGFIWYAYVTEVSLAEAFTVVALPLIPGDVAKLAAAVAVARSDVVDPT